MKKIKKPSTIPPISIDRIKVTLKKATVEAYLTAAEERSEFINRHHGTNVLKSKQFRKTLDRLGYVNGKRMTAADIAAMMDDGPMRNKSIPLSLLDMRNVDYFERLRNDYKARLGNVVLSMCKDIRHAEKHENRRVMRVNDLQRKIRAKHQRRYRKDLLRETQSALGAICHQERANFLKSVQQHERDIEFEKMQGNTAV